MTTDKGVVIFDVPKMRDLSSRPSEHIDALVSGYAARHRREKLLVVLQAYIDESVSQSGDEMFYMAGYINSAEQWAKFSDDWDAELRAAPSIDYLHMVEATNLRGQFRGWDPADRDRKVCRLAKLIRGYRPWSVEVSVSGKEYREIMKPVSPHLFGGPYFACFYATISVVEKYHRSMGLDVPVDFIFDENGRMGDDTVMMRRWVMDSAPELRRILASSPIFRDDKKVVPLQAADMLAWHLRREDEKGDEEPRAALDYLRAALSAMGV